MAAFGIAYVTATVGATIADFGGGLAITRALVSGRDGVRLAGLFLAGRLVSGTVVGAVIAVAGTQYAAGAALVDVKGAIAAAGMLTVVRSLSQGLQNVAQGFRMWWLDSVVAIGGPTLTVGLLIAVGGSMTAADLIGLHTSAYAVVCGIGLIVLAKSLRRNAETIPGLRVWSELAGLWQFAWPVGIASVMFQFTTWCESVIIASWRPAPEVSAFFLATSLLMLPRLMFSVIEAVAYVEMADIGKAGKAGFRHAVNAAEALVTVPLCLLLIVGYFTLEPLVETFYGSLHEEAAVAAMWLLPSVFIRLMTIPTTTALSGGLGDSASLRDSQILAFVGRIGLGLILIPSFGYRGAAIGTFVAHLGSWLYLNRRSDRVIGPSRPPASKLVPLLIAVGLVVLTQPLGSVGRWVPLVTAVTGWIVAASWLYGAEISQAVSRLELARIPSPASPVV
jgi:O-antigen/teichoic acid export membrane protein